MYNTYHTPVLVQELLDTFAVENEHRVCDATVGDGGYLVRLCEKFNNSIELIGVDADNEALDRVRQRFQDTARTPTLIHSNFRFLQDALAKQGVTNLDRVIFDLGLSSYQIDESGRGFSFRSEEPLSMSFDPTSSDTAYTVVNRWDRDVLETIIRGYGEERYAGRIARVITEARSEKPIETTNELRELIYNVVPSVYRHGRLHPATRTFQAIRIAVNDEMSALDEGLPAAFDLLNPSGRLAVISFHSLEDRRVKNLFRFWRDEGRGALIIKKPIQASQEERKKNPRARSAKLRIIEKI